MKTRYSLFLGALFFGSALTASAAVTDNGVMKPVNAVIVDEAAPYRWTGADAGKDWLSSIAGSFGKMKGAQLKAATQPSEMQFAGDSAYVAVPAQLSATNPAKPFRESGVLTFTLRKTNGEWIITSQAWGAAPQLR